MNVRPTPSDDETAAIVAALEALWPQPVIAVSEPAVQPSAWRFSGRWWARPVPLRRDRPYF
jgi:hypothetical protein